MMHSSLSRGHASGITVILSGRGFLSSYPAGDQTRRRELNGSQSANIAYDEGLLNTPVKLQLVNHKHGGYSIRVVHNDDRPRSQPIISEELDQVSVQNHTAQEFEFLLDRDGSRHSMLFSNLGEGQQFQSILSAVKVQGQFRMTSKRGVAPIAARFPGMQGSNDVGVGATIKKIGSKMGNDRGPTSKPTDNGEDIDIHTMVELLKSCIHAGDVENAEIWAGRLAMLQPKLSILVETAGTTTTMSPSSNISIHVQVEDKDSSKIKLRMSVSPNITIAGLKKMTCLKYDLPTQVQNWLIGGRIVKDTETLSMNRIVSSGATLYLYLTSAMKVNITKQDMEIDKHVFAEEQKHSQQRPEHKAHTMQRVPSSNSEGPQSTLRTSQNRVTMPSIDEPALLLTPASLTSRPSDKRSSSLRSPQLDLRPQVKRIPSATEVGWTCPACTLVNPPLIPGCQACSTDRPATYSVPAEGAYTMDPSEHVFQKGCKEDPQTFLQLEREQGLLNYQDLLRVDDQDLVLNQEPFDCPICLMDYVEEEGIVLRECIHTFCRECITQHVKQSEDALVRCPEMDNGVPCTQHVLEREIKALLNEQDFQKYLERGLRRAEASVANSFHCKTTDCRGFCFYEDNNNFFNCPLCKRMNCLTCKAIHEGIDCKQYQEDLKTRAQNDVTARQTQETLEGLVTSGEAMKCPMCSIIVQKKGGCDWIRCSVCQTEICWVTKQARWGKGGTGDITGGCRCRVNGQKCHPDCHNCH